MNVAVIGGTRHIGPSIIELAATAGHQVTVFNRGITPAQLPAGARHVKADRKVPGQLGAALRDQSPDILIDLIGYEASEVEEVINAVPSLKQYVFCGSTAVYGRIEKATPDERAPLAPDSPYTFGKVACEELLMNRHRQSGLPVTILRLAHPYGARDHLLYVTGRESLFLDRIRRGRPILIPGDGQTRLHPVYVEDVARAFLHVMGRTECVGGIYNLAGEQVLTLDEYFASIARVLGVSLVSRKLPNTFFKENARWWADWRRKFDFGYNWVRYESAFDVSALRDTGFECKTDHDNGVALTLEWLEARNLIPQSSDEDEEDLILKMEKERLS